MNKQDVISTMIAKQRKNMPARLARLRRNVPCELAALDQWVVWRYEFREGDHKATKVLYQAEKPLRHAKSNDASTWCGFERALTTFENFTNVAGVGFVFAKDDQLVGVDLDNVHTAAGFTELAQDILKRFHATYAEYSPSGEGVHIIVGGSLEGLQGRKKAPCEVYSEGRFFTVTGDMLEGFTPTVTTQQAALEGFHKRYIAKPEKAKKASQTVGKASPFVFATDDYIKRLEALKRHAKAARLFAGDSSAYPSPSEADQALANYCAFYFAGDVGMMSNAMNQSGLKREKWANIHDGEGGRTYLQITLDTALADFSGEVYDPSRYRPPARADGFKGGEGEDGKDGEDRPSYVPDALRFERTDTANAHRLRGYLGDQLAYNNELGLMIFDEVTGVFERDTTRHKTRRIASELLRYQLTLELEDLEARLAKIENAAKADTFEKEVVKPFRRFKVNSLNERPLTAAAKLVEDHSYIHAARFDAEPFIFVCANGALDLLTGGLHPHSPAHYATRRSPAVFDEDATHPFVDELINILEADGRAETLQRALGSALCGIAPNERIFYAVGEGGTGKSTLLDSVFTLLGSYAASVDTSLLVSNGVSQGASPELMTLRGARFALGSELPKRAWLDAPRVKQMSGRDVMSGRHLFKDPLEFRPVFKLFIHSNYDLKTDWDDTGVQRRLCRVPFRTKPAAPDPRFKATLQEDQRAQSALLAWLYQGFRKWHDSGYDLAESDLIREAKLEYLRNNDPFFEFSEEQLGFVKDISTPAADLRGAYLKWCEANGVRPQNTKDFAAWLTSKGCERLTARVAGKPCKVWKGVRLRGDFG